VLGFIGRPHQGPHNHIGPQQLEDMPLVAIEGPGARLASVSHLRVPQRRHPISGHASADSADLRDRIGLEILRQHAPQRGQRRLQRGGLPDVGDVARDPLLQLVNFRQ